MILTNKNKIGKIFYKGKKIKSIVKDNKLLFGEKLKFLTPYWMVIDQTSTKEIKFTKSPLIDSFFEWFMDNIKPCLAIMQDNGVVACAELWHRRIEEIPYHIERADAYALTEESCNTEMNDKMTDWMVWYPKVYYKGVKVEEDKWLIYFDKKPFTGCVSNFGDKLISWTCVDTCYTPDKIYGRKSVSEHSYDEMMERAKKRGEEYSIASWDVRCLLSVIYMINQGVNDIPGRNAFGLDSWTFDRDEWQSGCLNENKIVKVTHDDGTYEEFDCTFFPNNILSANINKFYFGKYLMLIPSEIGDLKNWGNQVGQGSPYNSGIGLYNNGPCWAAFPENSSNTPFSGAFDKTSAACKLMYTGPIEWMDTIEKLEYFKNLPVIN